MVVFVRDIATMGDDADDDAVTVWFWNRGLSAVNEGRFCSGFCSLSLLSYKIKICYILYITIYILCNNS